MSEFSMAGGDLRFNCTKKELGQLLKGVMTETGSALSFQGVEFDSRRVKKGELFVALPGSQGHGHDFLPQAFASGAALALVEDRSLIESSEYKDKLVYVPHTLEALWNLARHVRNKFSGKVIGLTGTIGKTTTRTVLALILEQLGSVNASRKSFNNHIGVPYTICNSALNADFSVFELGMNHAGELDKLSQLARPDVAVITTITPVHMEFFSNLGQVADAKCEILNGLPKTGMVILNSDNQELELAWQRWKQAHENQTSLKTIRFGVSDAADCQIVSLRDKLIEGFGLELELRGSLAAERYSAKKQSTHFDFSVPLIGVYNSTNVMAAIAVAFTLCPHIEPQLIEQALTQCQPETHRLNLLSMSNGGKLLDDCYNSSPEALRSVLGLLGAIKQQGKSIGLVLGGMHELGAFSEELHSQLAAEVVKLSPKFCFLVGPVALQFMPVLEKSSIPIRWFEKPLDARSAVEESVVDLLLIKGSRGVSLESLVSSLVVAS